MSDLEKVNNHKEEIDLLSVFRPLAQGATRIANHYFGKLWLNKWKLIGMVILSGLLGFSLRYVIPKRYRSDAILATSPHGLNAVFCSLLINNLNATTDKGDNVHLLETQLNLKPGTGNEIKSMSAVALTDSLYTESRDSSMTPVSLFKITLTVNSKEVVEEIQSGIVNFLENNKYALKRKEARRKSLLSLNEDYITKIASLDSLKKLVNSSVVPRSMGQGIILGQPINPIEVYQAEMIYYRDLLKNNEELGNVNNIEILQPFLIPDNYNYPDFKKIFLIMLGAGFLCALITAPLLGRK